MSLLHSTPPTVEVKNAWNHTSTLPICVPPRKNHRNFLGYDTVLFGTLANEFQCYGTGGRRGTPAAWWRRTLKVSELHKAQRLSYQVPLRHSERQDVAFCASVTMAISYTKPYAFQAPD